MSCLPPQSKRFSAPSAAVKRDALTAYAGFAKHIVSGYPASLEQDAALALLKAGIASYPVGIVAELNGSARGVSIDKDFITGFGLKLKVENGIPRQIVHRIVPEGESLNECSSLLERYHKDDKSFIFGYVPDNDGDRGNLVYVDRKGSAHVLEAQEVFALVCLAELAWLFHISRVHLKNDNGVSEKIAVAVNGPTSLRIERIAEAFDAKVFRAEVEKPMSSLSRMRSGRGYIVRILGEGSNGGNITYPSRRFGSSRDGFAVVKLLTVRRRKNVRVLFEFWCERTGRLEAYREDYTLDDIIATLPAFTTTSAFEERARLDIRTTNHLQLKKNYETVFSCEWDKEKR